MKPGRRPTTNSRRGTRLEKGIQLLFETEGSGTPAVKGSEVRYSARMFLRRGDEVMHDADIIARARQHVQVRVIGGVELIVHSTVLGRRQPIAGVEKSLYGMRPGGYREVMVAPHLAYGKKGVAGRIPPDAMLRIQLWLDAVVGPDNKA